ncbi:dTDP-4-dehydrorhamnose 3,5-epimerase [Glaciecola siphonariae]|uniref:dTDP-4-dehydrorhamnose 3,5-epimerase n=1 Tax=Glaciecola siphonariae TaxID=521012 RepID=A0ABV9LYR1_9ALTE
MQINESVINGVFEIENKMFQDHRGLFVKTFHEETFEKNGLSTNFKESFYSVSAKNVIRGMHFQKPPHDHAKLVYVTSGEILDVVLDIRKDSATYGRSISFRLSSENGRSVYIEKGCAHGFLTLSNSATVVYSTSTVHSAEADSGVLWNSFNFDWGIQNPIISGRDEVFPSFAQLSEDC